MEKLLEILEDIQPDADYETCTTEQYRDWETS